MKNKLYIVADLFYPAYMLIYFLAMFGINLSALVGYPLIMLLVFLALMIVFREDYMSRSRGRTLMIVWMLYNAFSIILYTMNGLPLMCYLWALRNYFFPMFFFFFGNYSKVTNNVFFKTFMLSCTFFLVVGLYLYYYMPSYYINFISYSSDNAWYTSGNVSDKTIMNIHRFSSFNSSPYVASALSVSCLICVLGYLMKPHKVPDWLLYVLAIICFVCAFLTMQRIAMVCSFLVVLVYSFIGFFKYRKTSILFAGVLVIGLFLFLIGYSYTDQRIGYIVEMLTKRFDKLNYGLAMSERIGQADNIDQEILSYLILGKGMGAGGHYAMRFGGIGLFDLGYYQMLLEMGLMGLAVFATLMVSTLVRGFRLFRVYNIEIIIIVFYLLCNIGENVFGQSYLITPVFWFCVGRIWNKNYYNRIIELQNNENISLLSSTVSPHKS